jgi:hypothetical protein
VGGKDHRKEDKLSRRRTKKSDPLLHDCWCGKVTQEQSGDLRKKRVTVCICDNFSS